MREQIITSLLDTDLYKFTMQQAMLHQYPNTDVVAKFKCRSSIDLTALLPELRQQIEALAGLTFKQDEIRYLKQLPYLKPDFVDFLATFKLQAHYINVGIEDNQLAVTVAGPWVQVTHFEIFLLAIISELYSRRYYSTVSIDEGRQRLYQKIKQIKQAQPDSGRLGFKLVDFGTRRRFSRNWHYEVVDVLKHELPDFFVGTSNVYLAREMDIAPIGTMAHEWIQAHQGLDVRLVDSQKAALEAWVKEYRGELGIALTDTISMQAFLRDFDRYLAKVFDGLRHDSGDPILWGEQALAHYKALDIDPKSKQLVFSDGLNITQALNIYQHFKGQTQTSFGVGTHLSHDLGVPAINMVLKLVECNGQPVAKLSDSPGKVMCHDETFVTYLKQVFAVAA
ncbi:nicotinate phosphoribosyltransferase [Zooshikella marina]|uniref:nicotinate phosphoribosyltransferase n=1 Tax=Zooshikella ganghwensis TaxID=202772 RepID=UPI001BAF9BEF|nr:nicotinate phosphoribosyltransferase [Zooshikella ganghwensis]MBU2704920.1 nicotinate phosphoribosyltransferase [Zooshikella ganghwensis]